MHACRSVLFDLDGTLVDSLPGITAGLRRTLELLGHTLAVDESLRWAVGPPLEEVMARLLAEFGDDRVGQAVALYREWYGAVGLFDSQVYAGVPALLDALRAAGKVLFVSTSKRSVLARRVIEHLGLAGHFRAVQGSEEGGRFDDKAELVRWLLEDEGIDPAQAVLVGDREHDVRAARACGVRGVAVTWGYGSRTELTAAGADTLCDSPAELAARLGGG